MDRSGENRKTTSDSESQSVAESCGTTAMGTSYTRQSTSLRLPRIGTATRNLQATPHDVHLVRLRARQLEADTIQKRTLIASLKTKIAERERLLRAISDSETGVVPDYRPVQPKNEELVVSMLEENTRVLEHTLEQTEKECAEIEASDDYALVVELEEQIKVMYCEKLRLEKRIKAVRAKRMDFTKRLAALNTRIEAEASSRILVEELKAQVEDGAAKYRSYFANLRKVENEKEIREKLAEGSDFDFSAYAKQKREEAENARKKAEEELAEARTTIDHDLAGVRTELAELLERLRAVPRREATAEA